MNRFLLGLLALGLAACGSAQRVTIERVSPGAECKAGGYKVVGAGADQLVCNGASGGSGDAGSGGTSGAPTLLAQSPLPAGDPRCKSGGVEVRAGLDSGADGGTAGDGVLQPGEVTSSSVVCNGDSRARVGSLTAPPGANGTATLRALGGLGTAGPGGGGGFVRMRTLSGTNGGHLKAWRTGRADASFTVPTPPAADLGPVPLAITTDTAITLAPQPSSVPSGTAFISAQRLYISRGPTLPADAVTGLSVAAGATLTLPLGIALGLPRSCRIDGTLKGDPAALLEVLPELGLSCGDVVFSATSKVLLAPTDDLSGEHGFQVFSSGALLALGTIDTSGFSPPAGSTAKPTNGGRVVLYAGTRLYAQGTITTTGGSGTTNLIPSGGSVELSAELGLSNAATIEASGGRVTASATAFASYGGSGGPVQLSVAGALGELRNRGAITSNGGAASAMGPNAAYGGPGGSIALETRHGPLTHDAALTVRGGEGTFRGGDGGRVKLSINGNPSGGFGSVVVSGSLDASGGTGPEGGNGGSIEAELGFGAALGAEVVLLGYESADVSGGVGLAGGQGGSVAFTQSPLRFTDSGGLLVPAGPGGAVVNTLALRAQGGDADTGQTGPGAAVGGRGGTIELLVQNQFGSGESFEVLLNSGALVANGGAGPTGGEGGGVSLFGAPQLTSSGAITCQGGAGSTNAGGSGGQVTLTARGSLSNSAAIDASAGLAGGGGVSFNGKGGTITLRSGAASNSGTLVARGGAASLALGTGGEGGRVTLESRTTATQNSVPAPAGIVVSGGTAATPGPSGSVLIDGVSVTDAWTH